MSSELLVLQMVWIGSCAGCCCAQYNVCLCDKQLYTLDITLDVSIDRIAGPLLSSWIIAPMHQPHSNAGFHTDHATASLMLAYVVRVTLLLTRP